MASNINPTNIDGNYPVAGQDNDSQGFRDNFTNIKNNLQFAKEEIGDLQSKAILKSALTGGTLNNDLNNAVIYKPQLKAASDSFRDLGTNNSGSLAVSFLDASVQKVVSASRTLTLTLSDFPATGLHGTVRLWVNISFAINQTSADLVFPNAVTLGVGNLTNYDHNTRTKTFNAAGDYLFEFSTVDGGQNFWVIQLA